MIKVVFYSRVSTEEEKQLNALSKQIQELTDYIHTQKDWALVDQYVDEGISGTTSKGRHEYNRLYNDLLTDKFDIVVIKDQSRLMRNVLDWYLFLDRVQKNGKKIYMYLDNCFYTPDNAFLSGIKAMMAEEYSRDLSKKIRSAAQRSQRNGTVYGNSRILGYRQDGGKLVIVEEEAEIVRQVFNWYIQGYGFRIIRDKLSAMGVTSTTGTPFSLSTLKRMIKQEKYKGLLISGKRRKNFETKQMEDVPKEEWVVIPNGVPAIVSEEVWEMANACLKERTSHPTDLQKEKGMYQSHSYPLSGKIYCGKCGKVYWHDHYLTKVNKLERDIWVCSSYKTYGSQRCKNRNMQDSFLTKAVQQVLFATYNNKEAIQTTLDILKLSLKEEEIKPELNLAKNTQLEKKMDNLLDAYLDGIITKDIYATKKASIEKQIQSNLAKYEEQLQQVKNIIPISERLVNIEKFLSADFKTPKDVDDITISNLVQKITINDKEVDILLKNGENTVIDDIYDYTKCDQEPLCVTETRQKRTHTEILYQTKIRRTKKRNDNSWIYFTVSLPIYQY